MASQGNILVRNTLPRTSGFSPLSLVRVIAPLPEQPMRLVSPMVGSVSATWELPLMGQVRETRVRLRRKAAIVAAAGGVLVGALGASAPAQAAPRDNLANARLCLRGGWKTLTTANGRSFRNQGLCIVYALFGGQFSPGTPPAPPGGDSGGE
jgi:hypothetical protein